MGRRYVSTSSTFSDNRHCGSLSERLYNFWNHYEEAVLYWSSAAWLLKRLNGLVRLVSIRGRWVSVRQNSLRLGERGCPSTQAASIRYRHTEKKHTDTQTERTKMYQVAQRQIICIDESLSFPEVLSRKISSPFPRS